MLTYKNKIYCLMNKDLEFIDEYFNTTKDIREAIGWQTIEQAKKERAELDEPDEFKIVEKTVYFEITKIID